MIHISDDELESYCLGTIDDEQTLERIEGHFFPRPHCARRAQSAYDYIEALRSAMRANRFDSAATWQYPARFALPVDGYCQEDAQLTPPCI